MVVQINGDRPGQTPSGRDRSRQPRWPHRNPMLRQPIIMTAMKSRQKSSNTRNALIQLKSRNAARKAPPAERAPSASSSSSSSAMITPPVGINLYVVHGLRRHGRIDDVIIGAAPFLLTMILMIAILSYLPQLALWLPRFAAN
jgi:hypothetical protein